MRSFAIGFLLVLSCASAGAQTGGESAFTATGDTCGDITWQPSVLERFPNIGTVCRAVIERDGRVYAQFKGIVHRRYGSTVYIRFEGGEAVPGGDRAVKIDPPSDMTFRVGDRSIQVRDAQPGQDLTIYIPGDRFVVNLGDEFVPTAVAEIAEVVPVAEVPESVRQHRLSRLRWPKPLHLRQWSQRQQWSRRHRQRSRPPPRPRPKGLHGRYTLAPRSRSS
jgi:hypothetical protein